MSDTKTPVAVRVARWTAITAAITALGTIGNTFIDKRPWFLGGEADEPKSAAVANAEPKKMSSVSPEVFEASPSVHFSLPTKEDKEKAALKFESDLVESLVKSGKAPEEAKAMARMAMSANVGATSAMSSENMPQAGVPDMGPWRNFLNFVEYRPVAAWLIMGSVSLTIVAVVTELFIRKRRKKVIMFDSQPPTT